MVSYFFFIHAIIANCFPPLFFPFFLLVSTFGFSYFSFCCFLHLYFSYFFCISVFHIFIISFCLSFSFFVIIFNLVFHFCYYFHFFIIYNFQDILQGTSFPRSLSLLPFFQHNGNAKVRCLCL